MKGKYAALAACGFVIVLGVVIPIYLGRSATLQPPTPQFFRACEPEYGQFLLLVDIEFDELDAHHWEFPLCWTPDEDTFPPGTMGTGISTNRAHGATDDGESFATSTSLYVDDDLEDGVVVDVSGYWVIGDNEEADFQTRIIAQFDRPYRKQLGDRVHVNARIVESKGANEVHSGG